VAEAVLGHRVLLDIDRQLRGVTAEAVIDGLQASVDAPPIDAGQRPAGAKGAGAP
jgi:hypothetical protein